MATSIVEERKKKKKKLAESFVATAKRMGITGTKLSKMTPEARERVIGNIIKQQKTDDAALRGVNTTQSTWGKRLQKIDGKKLQGILNSGVYGGGKKLNDRQRMFIQGELDRRKLAEAGPGHVMLESGGKKYVVKGRDLSTNQAALSDIQSGKVSFEPDATRGLSKEIAAEYGAARSKAVTDALAVIDNDATFTKKNNWDKLTTGQKLTEYSKHIVATTGSTIVPTYQNIKDEWLQAQKEKTAQRRRDIADAANPGAVGVAGMTNSKIPGAGAVEVGDLLGAPKTGFSGANGMPYRAGDPNRRNVQEYGRALAREKSEQAMYRDQQRRERMQQEKDSANFTQYYLANYNAIQARQALARAQQKAELERLKQAEQYVTMASFASREAQAGGGAV
jgi:hypothetical protein